MCIRDSAGTASLANAQGYGAYGGNRGGTSFGIRLGGIGISYTSPRSTSRYGAYRPGYGAYGRGGPGYAVPSKYRKPVHAVRRGYGYAPSRGGRYGYGY